jgi:transcriptional regulator GlxA family with amidase domain
MILAMRIFVVPLDGVFDTGLAVVLDAFATANELARSAGMTATRFDVSLIGVRRRVRTAQGLSVPTIVAGGTAKPDAVIVPALGAKMPDALGDALARPDVRDAGTLLRKWADQKALIAAACTSTFVVAETSLLDGHRATTTWWLAPMFRERYPSVRLDESQMLTESSRFLTAGAALAHLDAALWMVRQQSPALAALCARYLVVEPRPSQAQFIIPDHLAHSDPIVERFERWARAHLARGFSLSTAARAVGASERTLARRLARVLGKPPLAYFQDLRVERAVHLLQSSSHSLEQIATEVGYADGVSLRALLRKKIGRGVREIRAQRLAVRTDQPAE